MLAQILFETPTLFQLSANSCTATGLTEASNGDKLAGAMEAPKLYPEQLRKIQFNRLFQMG
jgi:hypothetical protein